MRYADFVIYILTKANIHINTLQSILYSYAPDLIHQEYILK